jgi:hypothetical protein
MPARLSEGPAEKPPSRAIEVFWWAAFIVPIIFAWFAFQSLVLIGVIVGIRIVIMFIPKGWKTLKTKPAVKPAIKEAIPEPAKVNTKSGTLTPFIEEAQVEWRWLLKALRFYDHEREEKYLDDYRRLRGWK